MGASNVAAAFTRWRPQLRDGPMCLLAYMALTARDADSPPRFWGGRESLVLALGRRLPPVVPTDHPDHYANTLEREAAFTAVKRALKALRLAGAITLLNTPGPGERANYRLNLALSPMGDDS